MCLRLRPVAAAMSFISTNLGSVAGGWRVLFCFGILILQCKSPAAAAYEGAPATGLVKGLVCVGRVAQRRSVWRFMASSPILSGYNAGQVFGPYFIFFNQ